MMAEEKNKENIEETKAEDLEVKEGQEKKSDDEKSERTGLETLWAR